MTLIKKNKKHPEFLNSFTTKELKEADEDQIFAVLKSRTKLHAKHGVLINDEVLRHLITITHRFKGMYDTAQPNRSIRLLDSAATAFRMEVHSMTPGAYDKNKTLKALEFQLSSMEEAHDDYESVKSQVSLLYARERLA